MNKIAKITLIVAFVSLVFSFLTYNSFGYLDCDFGWHLLFGQETIQNKDVPRIETHDYTVESYGWVDHEWLYNVLIYLGFDSFGYIFISVFFVFLVLVTFLLLAIQTKKYFLPADAGWSVLSIVLLSGVIACSPHFGVRLQELALLCLTILIFLLHKFTLTKKIKILYWLPWLFLFWANLHGSFLIGFFVIALWVAIKLIEIFFKRKSVAGIIYYSEITVKDIKKVIMISVVSLLVTLINPYGIGLYSFLKEYSNSFYLTRIMEWQPSFYLPLNYWQLSYLAVVAAFLVLTAVFTWKKWPQSPSGASSKINLWHITLTLVFMFLAFKSKRHFPLFFIVSFPFTITFLYQYFPFPSSCKKIITDNVILNFFTAIILLVLAANFILKINFTNDPFANKYCGYYPCQAIEVIKNEPRYAQARLFNTYGWGGYLLWVWPEKQIFIDGRMPQIAYKKHSFYEEYYDFFDKEKQTGKIAEHEIELFLLQKPRHYQLDWVEKHILGLKQKNIDEQKDVLIEYLKNSNEWQPIYEDDISIALALKKIVDSR